MKSQHGFIAALILVLTFGLGNVAHTAAGNATLEERLKKLEDTEAIRTLLIEYGRHLDDRNFKAYGRLFARDGSWQGGMGSASTPEGIQKMVEDGFSRMAPELYENSNHVMTSFDIEVNGDTARAWSRWMWVVVGTDGKPRTERAGRYEDALVREEGRWKFKKRMTTTEINP
jgi:hypothetical protein